MEKNTIVAGGLVLGVVVAGVYFYTKMKAPTAAQSAAAAKATGTAALTTAGINAGATVATSELSNFTSWLTAPGANTASTNSTSGTYSDNSGYDDTGLDDLYS